MENVILTVHLILALLLIGVVLLQRSEGGGLGMGGGGGVMTGRQAANALSKATWIIAIAFLATSTMLTLLAARQGSISSVIDQLGLSTDVSAPAPATGLPGLPDYTPPPGSPILPGAGQPLTPPAPAAPVAAPEAAPEAPAADSTDTPAPASN